MTNPYDGSYGRPQPPPAPQSGWTPAQPGPQGHGHYGTEPPLPPLPPSRKSVPWLLVAAGVVVALAAAVLIVVLTKDDSTPVADPSGSSTPTASAPTSSADDSEPPQPSDPTAAGSSEATQAELESETSVMLKKFSAQDHDELVKWVCKKDADSFESSWQKGTFTKLKDATFTIVSSTLDSDVKSDSGATATGVVKATMAPSGGGSITTTWPMSWRHSTANTYEWYVCPSDQPGVIDT